MMMKRLLLVVIFMVQMIPGISAAATINLALSSNGGLATQSSTALGAVASLANDGNTDGDFYNGSVTHTWTSPGEWWEVDLGGAYQIEEIDIWNRTDSGVAGRLHHFTVSILDTMHDSIWSTYYDGPVGINEDFGSIGGTPLAYGQFVKIQFDPSYGGSRRYLHMAEVQVWGDSSPVPIPAAAWLFGSGLLGLIGFSKRKKAAC